MPETADRPENIILRLAVETHSLTARDIAQATGRNAGNIRRMLGGQYAVTMDVARYVLKETGDAKLRAWLLGAEVDPAAIRDKQIREALEASSIAIHSAKRNAPKADLANRCAAASAAILRLARDDAPVMPHPSSLTEGEIFSLDMTG